MISGAQPVVLGQTRVGLLLPVVLVLSRGLGRAAHAQVFESGYSENDYFRIEWFYELDWGTGFITLRPLREGQLVLYHANLMTTGVLLDDIWITGSEYGDPIEIGAGGGRTDFYYPLLSAVALNGPIHIDLTFPTTNVSLKPSSFYYAGNLSAPWLNVVIPPLSSQFVTVQALPLPGEDADQDGVIDREDVCPGTYAPGGVDGEGRPLGDLDGSCNVNLNDFSTLANNFGG